MSGPAPETVVLAVDIKSNTVQLIALEKLLKEAKDAMQALTKANKDGKVSNDDLALAQNRYKTQTVAITGEIKLLNNMNQQQIAINKAAAGSVDQLKAKAALLTTQYNSLSQAERSNTAAGQALTAELLKTNEALKDAGVKVGDNRRGIGGYKDAIVAAAKETGLFGGVTERLSGFQEKYAAAQKLTAIVTGETTGVTKALRVAFLAIPLFAVIGLLGTLYTFLTSTQKGMDFVERKTAAVGAAFNVLLKIAAPVGETLLRLFTEPGKALDDLVTFLENNVANRFKAFGVLVDAIRNRDFTKLTDGVIQLSTGITDGTAKAKALGREIGSATDAQEKLTGATQRIRAAERALNVERDQSRAKIEGLKKLSDDSAKSVGIRTKAAKEAADIETGLLARQLKLQQDKVNNLVAEQRLKGNITNADKDELAALQSEQAKTAQESLTLQTELQNKFNALGVEAAAQAAKRRQDAVKGEQTAVALRLAEVAKGSAAELVLLQKQVDLAARLTLAAETQTANERKLILANAETDKRKLQDDFNAKATDAEKKRLETAKTEQKREYDENVGLLENYLAKRSLALEKELVSGAITEEEYKSRGLLNTQTGLTARLTLAKEYAQDIAGIEQQITENEKAQLRERTKEQHDAYKKQVEAGQVFGEQLGALVAETLLSTGASYEDFASKVLILILDSLEKAVLAAQLEASVKTIAADPTPLGFVQAAVTAAAITAAFEVAKGAISKPVNKQFAEGGIINGPSHAAGGVPFSVGGRLGFEAEGGEAIISRGAVQRFAPLLSHLNQLGGGVAFATGGLVPGVAQRPAPMSDGGFVARQMAGTGLDYNALAWAISKLPPSELVLTELRNANTRKAKIVGLTTLGG